MKTRRTTRKNPKNSKDAKLRALLDVGLLPEAVKAHQGAMSPSEAASLILVATPATWLALHAFSTADPVRIARAAAARIGVAIRVVDADDGVDLSPDGGILVIKDLNLAERSRQAAWATFLLNDLPGKWRVVLTETEYKHLIPAFENRVNRVHVA